MKKRILPLLCALYPYLYVIYALMLRERVFADSLLPRLLLIAIPLLGLLLGIAGLVMGLRLPPEQAAGWGFAVKVTHIPFYLFMSYMTLGAPLLALLFWLLDLIALVCGSGFGIAAIYRAWKERRLTALWAAVFLVLHCIFVLDLIGAYLLRSRLKTT